MYVADGRYHCHHRDNALASSTLYPSTFSPAANNPNTLLTMYDHADLSALNNLSRPADIYQSSQAYLAASWSVTTPQGLAPVRYEVSAGRSDQSSPMGIFDPVKDRVWRDVGLETSSVIVIPTGQSLFSVVVLTGSLSLWFP